MFWVTSKIANVLRSGAYWPYPYPFQCPLIISDSSLILWNEYNSCSGSSLLRTQCACASIWVRVNPCRVRGAGSQMKLLAVGSEYNVSPLLSTILNWCPVKETWLRRKRGRLATGMKAGMLVCWTTVCLPPMTAWHTSSPSCPLAWPWPPPGTSWVRWGRWPAVWASHWATAWLPLKKKMFTVIDFILL